MSKNETKCWYFEYVSCFTTGFAVLILELTAFRILAPHFGTSCYVTGIIINIILFAFAAGYALGGYAADRYHSWKLPYIAIFLSAVYLIIMYMVYPSLLQSIAAGSVIVRASAAVILLFFAPMVLTAFLPPYLIRMISMRGDVGKTSGKIYAVSTLGNIFGGIATTFIFIPYLGSHSTFFLADMLLFAVAIFGLFKKRTIKVLILLLLLPLHEVISWNDCNCLYRGESEYNLITISEEEGRRYLKLNDGLGFHSQSLDPSTSLTGEYFDYFLLPQMLTGTTTTLILGNGAGTAMMQAARLFDTDIDGVEIDPALTALGKRYFGLNLTDRQHVFHQDARTYINKNTKQYDVILVDIYAGSPFVPFHVTTVQFYREIFRSLTRNGIVAVNIPFFALGHELGAYYLGTIASIFPGRTYVSGCVVYAFASETSADEIREATRDRGFPQALSELSEKIVSHLQEVTVSGGNRIFSDDHAPVEKLTQDLLWDGLRYTSCEQLSRFP